mgnify:CR=1 FL=1
MNTENDIEKEDFEVCDKQTEGWFAFELFMVSTCQLRACEAIQSLYLIHI